MTAAAVASPTSPRHGGTHAGGHALTFGGVLRSEWIKFRSVRSTFWCYVSIIILTIGLGLLIAGALPVQKIAPSHDAQQASWLQAATLGISFAQLVSAVLGALAITGEYGTGMIRSTFTAVPKRLPAIVAKVLVLGVSTFVIALASLVITAFVTIPILEGKGIHADLGDGTVWLGLVGGAGYLALVGVIALGIGLIVRNSAGGIAAALGLVLVVPIIFQVLSGVTQAVWPGNIAAFLPSHAGATLYAYPGATAVATTPPRGGGAVTTAVADTITLDSWQSLLVLVAWAVAALVVGAVLLKRRDV